MFSILLTPPAPLVKGGVEGETFILGGSQFPRLVPPLTTGALVIAKRDEVWRVRGVRF